MARLRRLLDYQLDGVYLYALRQQDPSNTRKGWGFLYHCRGFDHHHRLRSDATCARYECIRLERMDKLYGIFE